MLVLLSNYCFENQRIFLATCKDFGDGWVGSGNYMTIPNLILHYFANYTFDFSDHERPGPEPSAPPRENHTNNYNSSVPPRDYTAQYNNPSAPPGGNTGNNRLYPDLPDASAPPYPSEQSARSSQPPYPTEDSSSFPAPQPPPPSQTVNQEELRRRRLARFK